MKEKQKKYTVKICMYLLVGIFTFSCFEPQTTSSSTSIDCIGEYNFTNDPLTPCQWHLNNQEQFSFSRSQGIQDIDINLPENYTGEGVVINIIDEAMDLLHEDYTSNILMEEVYDCSPSVVQSRDHATSIAGIIAAIKNNNIGGQGIAPDSKIFNYNFIIEQTQSCILSALEAEADIFNLSFGQTGNNFVYSNEYVVNQYKLGTEELRDGKGANYVKAVGNDFFSNKSYCSLADYLNVSCFNSNYSHDNSLPYVMTVGAVNASGVRSSYSNAGSSIFISGLGGEYGVFQPAIITTDVSGCDEGYSQRFTFILFDSGNHILNRDCNYTSSFNGTSAAVPTVVGVIALVLEANPSLTWLDIRYILAKTARKIDSDRKALYATQQQSVQRGILSNALIEQGWITNTAGFHFHNWYGFGLVDATEAIRMAESFVPTENLLLTVTSDSDVNRIIPDVSSTGASDIISILNTVVVSTAQIVLNVTHNSPKDLSVLLSSPQGTTSLLLNVGNSFTNWHSNGVILSSNAFFQETSAGDWTLQVIDNMEETEGTIISWQLNLYGTSFPY